MACSKIFSGNLPELLNEIIQYFRNDFLTLHSCILVNRLWCRLAIPLLWEDPFSNPTANYHFIRNFLYNLNDNDKTKLIEYEINIDLIPSNTLFNYPNYIKCLNTWKIFHYIEKWIDFIKLGTPLNSDKIKEISKIIFNSILKNENNINLRIFEIILIRDHDYFNDILELILQNQNLILNIKNLKISFNGIIKTTNIFYDFLKFLYNNCKTISILYFHHKMNYDDLLIIKYCSELIISQQNLEKMLFGFHIYNSIFLSLKNSNCFDYQNIYLSMDLIKKFNNHHLNYIIIDFDRLHILNQPNDDILNISSIILKELGQILPLKLEYLDLSLSIDENIFEIFLKNSQNTFIKKLLINNKIQIGNENILSFIKEYIMKKKKIDYFAFKMKDDSDDSIEKCKDLFSMKDEVKIFESYNIKVQNYGDLKIQHYSYIEEMY
ncbi:unnamed protein product [Rhizophagus irregularis]|nr:unnamed protein product [Rhizophagus irregularis]